MSGYVFCFGFKIQISTTPSMSLRRLCRSPWDKVLVHPGNLSISFNVSMLAVEVLVGRTCKRKRAVDGPVSVKKARAGVAPSTAWRFASQAAHPIKRARVGDIPSADQGSTCQVTSSAPVSSSAAVVAKWS